MTGRRLCGVAMVAWWVAMGACATSGTGVDTTTSPGDDGGGPLHDSAKGDGPSPDSIVTDTGHDAFDASPGDDTSADTSGDDTSDAAAADASDAGDATIVDAGDGGAADAGDAGVPLGVLYFEQTGASAVFIGEFYAQPPSACTQTAYGQCTYYDCPTSADAGLVGAGTLTITGGTLPVNGATVSQSGPGYYLYQTSFSFAQGDTLGASASGGQVPAFAQHTVVSPASITMTQPQAINGAYAISTSQDLTITWTGGQSGAQALFEAYGQTATSQRYTECIWDATLGQGIMPKASLASLLGTTGGQFFWGQMNSTNFSSGSFPLQLAALPYGYGTATYQ